MTRSDGILQYSKVQSEAVDLERFLCRVGNPSRGREGGGKHTDTPLILIGEHSGVTRVLMLGVKENAIIKPL
jgi:hypothetical protein